jgi:unsaturated chondroitin disaccharide hydrolase
MLLPMTDACVTRALALSAAVVAVGALATATGAPGAPARRETTVEPRLTTLPATVLDAGGRAALARTLPARWAVSADLRVPAGAELRVRIGGPGATLTLLGRRGVAAWRHVEATPGIAAVDGRTVRLSAGAGPPRLVLRSVRGRARVDTAIVSGDADPATLLLHRVAGIHATTPPGRFPVGTTVDGRRVYDGGWMRGFYAGALWQAARLDPGGPYEGWALQATLANFGAERVAVHDQGFMYGPSSLAAYERLCGAGTATPAALCDRLRASVITAAGTLRDLAASNAAAGTIPTNARGQEADTIIDSMMNLGILTWATHATGDPSYAALARRHAHDVGALLVRPDGATLQSVHVRRADGAVLFTHTHQGLADDSVWARGQAWAVYGFAQTGRALHAPALVAVSERAARYVALHLPPDGVPRFDYLAGPGAPLDVSAGVITAAGLYRLDAACRALPDACTQPGRWAPLASRMLDAALRGTQRSAAGGLLGMLGSQVYIYDGGKAWQRDGELVMGLDYALEALTARARLAAAPR